MEFVGGIFTELIIESAKSQWNYVFRYRRNLQDLSIKVKELSNAREDMKRLADTEERNGRSILHSVIDWMKSVDEIIIKANTLLEEDRKAKSKCTPGKACYQRRKKVTRLAGRVVELLRKKVDFSNGISYDAPVQETWTEASKDYLNLGSRISLVDKIMNELQNMSVIGVYGMSGVGKTTFAKDVAREAIKAMYFFDDVVLVPDVKQILKLEEIQKKIAGSLDLKFSGDQTLEKGANLIFNRVKDKKVLVILDDVWEEIDLEKLGLHSVRCKKLMTARSADVLSSKMGTQKVFPLDVLNEKETWCLLEKIAGDQVDNDPKIKKVAKKIASKCGGLPVLIVTVAGALRNKTSLHHWKDAWRRLKYFDEREDLLKKAYSGIEWSYNQLDDEEAKKLFLFCCSIASRRHSFNDILKYSIGMSLFENVRTVKAARGKLRTLVDKLKYSCLLLDDVTNESFSIHDLVREVGISIKRRDENILSIGEEQELEAWPDNDSLKNCTMITFYFCTICSLPKRLECPKLECFVFGNNSANNIQEISSSFFKEMKTLKVLDLTAFNMSLLPLSFVSLTNLTTLCLEESVLGDISLVGQLKNLEILSFQRSRFKQLPKEIGQLTHLRWLDLSYCLELEVIAPNVLSCLTSLEELKIKKSFNRWEIEGNASLSELKKLSQLATLEIHIPNASLLPVNFFSNKLKNFKILIGDIWDWGDVFEETSNKMLKLKLVRSSQLDQGLKRLLKKSEILYLDEMEGVDNIFSQFESEGFQYLKHLHLQNNTNFRYVIPSFGFKNSNIDVFPSLESLVLQNLSSIKHLCSGHLNFEPFKKLISIKVNRCPNLKSLLSFSIAKCLSQLKEIEVVDCDIMEEIVGQEKDDDDYLINKANVIIEFNKMRSLILKKLPMLVGFSFKGNNVDDESIRINELPQRNHDSNEIIEEIDVHASTRTNELQLFSGEVLLPNLETLDLSSIPSNILCDDQHSTSSSSWVQNLKTLRVSNCDGLKFLLSSSMASSMVQLKHLEIMGCVNLTEIVSLNQVNNAVFEADELFNKSESMMPVADGMLLVYKTTFQVYRKPSNILLGDQLSTSSSGDNAVIKADEQFSKLKSMRLVELPNLVSFSSTSQYRNFQMRHAPHDYSLFDGMVQFPSLVRMEISGLDTVTSIWHNKLPPNSFGALKEVKIEFCPSVDAFVKHHHAFLSNLHSIEIRNCSNLKNVIPASLAGSLQGLEQLVVKHCGVLEEILKKEEEHESNQLIIFEFPKVKYVKFISLPQLRSFYGGLHSSKWPSLTHLKVLLGRNNNKVQILAKEHSGFQEKCNMYNPCIPIKQPLFLIEKGSFPNLKKLCLGAAMEVCDDPTTAACLSKAKDFFFACNNVNSSNIFLTNCSRYFHGSFEGLHLSRALFSELFVDADIEQEFGTLPHLKALVIRKMPYLTNLWKENSQTASVLPNLEFLQVFECDRLKNIVSSAIAFHNLTMLRVFNCHGLKYLVTYSVAKSLTQLKSMTVCDCRRMRVIVESSDGDNDEDDGNNINNTEIVFEKLRYLNFKSLPSLGGFCSGNDHCCVKVPSLKALYVTDCNIELKISDEGVPTDNKSARCLIVQSHSNLEAFQQITTDKNLDVDDDETVPVQDINVDDYDDYDYIYDNDRTIFQSCEKLLSVLIQSKC